MSHITPEEKVIRLIDNYKNDIVALMQKLVQIPSYSGEEMAMGEFLVEEVKNGIISVQQARDVYGLVIDPESFEIDEEETKKLRS